MVTFLNPWAALAAVLLVLSLAALRLLRRLLAPSFTFPPLPWLMEAERLLSLRRRLARAVDFFFCAASIVLLGFVFARPVFSPGPRSQRAVILILDGSLSMRAGKPATSFEEAKRAAGEILNSLGEHDRVNIAVAGATVRWAYENAPLARSRGRIWRFLERAEPGHGNAEVEKALEEAVAGLRNAPEPDRRLYLLSDFQESTWLGRRAPAGGGIRVHAIAVGKGFAGNVAVHLSGASCLVGFPGEPLLVRLRIRNYGKTERKMEIRWKLEGKALRTSPLTVRGGESVKVLESFSFPDPGVYEGECVIRGESEFEEDNRVLFSCLILSSAHVAAAASDSRVEELLRAAVGAEGNSPEPERVRTSGEEPQERKPYDVIVAAGSAAPWADPPIAASAVVFAGPAVPPPPGLEEELAARSGSFRLSSSLAGRTVTEIPALNAIIVSGRRRAPGGRRIVARFADGAPAAVILPERNCVLCLFDPGLGPEGLLGNEEAAVIFLGELVRIALSERFPRADAGLPFRLLLPRRTYRFFSPGGREIFPRSKPRGDFAAVDIPPLEPGFLRIRTAGRLCLSIPVNVPSSESAPASNPPGWSKATGTPNTLRAEKEITGYLVGLLLLVQVLWFLLSAPPRERERRKP